MLCAVLTSPALGDIDTTDESTGTRVEIGAAANFERELQSITAQVRQRCGPGRPERPQREAQLSALEAIQALELAEREAEANSATLSNMLDIFNAVSGILVALLAITKIPVVGPLIRRFPVVSVLQVGAQRVLSRVEGFIGTVLARKAANDTSWTIIRNTIDQLKKAA